MPEFTALAAALQTAPINANTAISVALVIVIVGATWKISAVLTKICVQLEPLTKLPEDLNKLKTKVGEVGAHVEGLEDDVNNLWATLRGEGLEVARKKNRRPWTAADDTQPS